MHCTDLYILWFAKRTEATSNSEKIKLVAFAVIELYLSEGISQEVSQSISQEVSQSVENSTESFFLNFVYSATVLEELQVVLKGIL